MLRTILVTTAILWGPTIANADPATFNPDQDPSAVTMATFGRTTVPIGYYEFCRRARDECAVETSARPIHLNDVSWRAIMEVNDAVNGSVRPRTDLELFGESERWTYPNGEGDCEDYALLKRRLLHERGFPLGALLMTVAHDESGGGHAVLIVVTDRGDFVLDNVEKRVLPWSEARLHYLKRQSAADPNEWVDLSLDPTLPFGHVSAAIERP